MPTRCLPDADGSLFLLPAIRRDIGHPSITRKDGTPTDTAQPLSIRILHTSMSAVKEATIAQAADEIEFYKSESVPFGTPYIPKEQQSLKNTQLVLQEIAKRFPDFLSQAVPYQNVLTYRQWRNRGYRVKKGEKSIRIGIMKEIPDGDDPNAKRLVKRTACLFALPQVEEDK